MLSLFGVLLLLVGDITLWFKKKHMHVNYNCNLRHLTMHWGVKWCVPSLHGCLYCTKQCKQMLNVGANVHTLIENCVYNSKRHGTLHPVCDPLYEVRQFHCATIIIYFITLCSQPCVWTSRCIMTYTSSLWYTNPNSSAQFESYL